MHRRPTHPLQSTRRWCASPSGSRPSPTSSPTSSAPSADGGSAPVQTSRIDSVSSAEMLVLVVIESVVLALLALLVAGLLRSHAEILRTFHDLGVGSDPDALARAGAQVPVGT